MSTKVVHSLSSSQTKQLAEQMAKEILAVPPGKKAVVLALFGELGSAKTTFLQGFAKGLGIKEKILSPTFVLFKKFQVSKSRSFFHFDCYRINKSEEISELGFKEIIADPQNIVAVEWADRIKRILPKELISVHFEFQKGNVRKITISH